MCLPLKTRCGLCSCELRACVSASVSQCLSVRVIGVWKLKCPAVVTTHPDPDNIFFATSTEMRAGLVDQ